MLSLCLCLAWLISTLPGTALAINLQDETAEVLSASTVVQTVDTEESELPDNDELFAGYVQQMLYPQHGVSLFADFGQSALEGKNLDIYEELKAKIQNIASNGGTTILELTTSLDISWNTTATGAALQNEAKEKFSQVVDTDKIMDCLLVDCPYELYWYDKVTGASWSYSISSNGTTASISGLKFTFKVATGYQDENDTTVDADKATAAAKAVETAASIVKDNQSKSDYKKLLAYKEKICDLVSYNDAAANEENNTPYGDPWQIIYVFDGDSSTNVVCEGYAKAFQYLCDLSEFEGDVVCYTVTGEMSGGTGAGPHMWNIVRIDGNSYLVDVTNCDTGTVGADDELFLKAPTSGNISEYFFKIDNSNEISYEYDSDTNNLYNDTILTLSTKSYQPITGSVSISGTPKIGVELTANVSGTPEGATLSYQWYRVDSLGQKNEIDDATQSTYTPSTADDVGQNIYVEVTAEGYVGTLTATTTATVVKGDATAPDSAPTATATAYTITVTNPNPAYEYACVLAGVSPTEWQESGTFSNLQPSTKYDIYARVTETETHEASDPSAPYEITTAKGPISQVSLQIQSPVATGATISDVRFVAVNSSGLFTVDAGSLKWYCGNTEVQTDKFLGNTVYTAKFTISPASGESFAGSVTVTFLDGTSTTVSPNNDGKLEISKTFEQTGSATVTGIAVTAQPTKTQYVEGETFDPTGMVVTVTYDDGSTKTVTDYTYPTEPLTAGTTQVTISYGGKEIQVAVEVLGKPEVSDFSINLPSNVTYDGQQHAATVASSITGMGAVTVYYEGTDYAKSTTPPTNAGTYQVTFDVAQTEQYAAAAGLEAGTFTIAKATPTIQISNTAYTVKKGNSVDLGAAITPTGLTLTYESENTGIATVDENGTVTGVSEGNTTITISFNGDNNYKPVSQPVGVTVTAKDPITVTFASPASKSYTTDGYSLGEQFTQATVGDASFAGTAQYRYDEKTYDTLDALKEIIVKDAGEYTVTAFYEDETYYGEASATFTITKIDQEALTITSQGPATYGQDYILTTEGGSGEGEVTYTVTPGTGDATIQGSTLHPTKAGTVTVTATKAADNNYNQISSQPLEITIDKGIYTGTLSASLSARSGQSAILDLSTLALPEGYVFGEWSMEDADKIVNTCNLEGTTLTVALHAAAQEEQTATITVPIVETTNYAASEEEPIALTVTISVNNKENALLDVQDITVVYNGEPVPDSAIVGTATVEGQAIAGSWSWTDKAPTNVKESGQYSVTFTPEDSENYNSMYTTVTVTIEKATPTGAPKYTAIVSNDKTLADAKLTTEGSTFSVPGSVKWKLPDTTPVTVNTYYEWVFTPTDSDNYKELTGTIRPWYKSSSSSSSSDSSSSNSNTSQNADGSTTTTVTNPNGTVTETTRYPDGSKEVVKTDKNGTITTTQTDVNGNQTTVVENPDGFTTTTIDNRDGSSSVTVVDDKGHVITNAKLSSQSLSSADSSKPVSLPMPSVPVTTDRNGAPTVTLSLPANTAADVLIPVEHVTPGTVAMLVKADGTEEVIKTTVTMTDGIAVKVSDSVTLKIVDNTKSFEDVPSNHWGADSISFATSRELFSGTGNDTFSPEEPMTRAMIVTVLARLENVDTSTGATWYEAGQQWAIANGISDGSNLEASLTREQLATMLYRYAGSPAVSGSLNQFSDVSSVSNYATDAMAWAVQNGLISGMGNDTLAPQGQATRAQVAAILQRFLEN